MVLRAPLGKYVVCLIAFIHSLFLYDGISTTIYEDELYARDEDLQHKEKVESIFLYGLHFILIFSLIYSMFKGSASSLLPWLVVTFPVFVYMTFMVIRGLKDMRWYLIDILLANFCFVGISWLFWSMLYLIFKTGDYRNVGVFEKWFSLFNHSLKRIIRKIRG